MSICCTASQTRIRDQILRQADGFLPVADRSLSAVPPRTGSSLLVTDRTAQAAQLAKCRLEVKNVLTHGGKRKVVRRDGLDGESRAVRCGATFICHNGSVSDW